jgi:uncharacterized tellurite resistance protein B-like protein
MRSYPRNSPEAAARIVALAMLADGHLCKTELDAVGRLDGHEQLGLDPAQLHSVMHTFCEDLLAAAHGSWSDACRIDPHTLGELMAEIDDAELRSKVLRLCVAVVESDGHVAEGESIVLVAAVEQWGLHREMLRTEAPDEKAAHV